MQTDSWFMCVLALVFALVLGGCPQRSDDRSVQLTEIIHDHNKDERLNDLRAIFVLAEEDCLPCTKAFAGIVEEHLDDPTCLFWVSATGAGLDISPFRSSAERVVWDYDDRLQASGILSGSGAIILKDGKIDTIVKIGNARTVQSSLNYLSDLLERRGSDSLDIELSP